MSKKIEDCSGSNPERKKCNKPVNSDPTLAIVWPEALYPAPVFEQLFGIGKTSLRSARSMGFPERYISGKAWIYGQDWIDYVLKNASTEPPQAGKKAP